MTVHSTHWGFMFVKWHFSWVHTSSFLPVPVFCESWMWLYWSTRRVTVWAVSQWSSSTVQFFCQGFLGFLLAMAACTDQVKSFVFSIIEHETKFAANCRVLKKRKEDGAICHLLFKVCCRNVTTSTIDAQVGPADSYKWYLYSYVLHNFVEHDEHYLKFFSTCSISHFLWHLWPQNHFLILLLKNMMMKSCCIMHQQGPIYVVPVWEELDWC